MRVALDMRHLAARMHGMARYAIELAKAMLDQDPGLQIQAIIREPEHLAQLPEHPRLTTALCDLAPYGLAAQLKLPGFLRRLAPDIYHCPFYAPPRFYQGPMLVTIHDLIHLLFPLDHGLKHRLFYRLVVGPAARACARVLTVSSHSAGDISRLLGVAPDKILVTPNGASPAYRPLAEGDRERASALGLPVNYVLGVGNPKPHKNLAALTRAHRMLKNLLPPDSPVPPLVLVGVRPAELEEPAPPDWLLLEGLDEPELALTYAAARLVVIPSLYEGFGLPALEALASGAPLVAANRASLPEVVGQAGLLAEPDPASLARAMARILGDPGLAAEFSAAGPAQAQKFTWASAADVTLKAYREALET